MKNGVSPSDAQFYINQKMTRHSYFNETNVINNTSSRLRIAQPKKKYTVDPKLEALILYYQTPGRLAFSVNLQSWPSRFVL
jgi:hypothetical protein